MVADSNHFEVFSSDNKVGLRIKGNDYVVLPAKYKDIHISPTYSYITTFEDEEIEILLFTYDNISRTIALCNQHLEYFVDYLGNIVFVLDKNWKGYKKYGIPRIISGYNGGVAVLEYEADEYVAYRCIVDDKGAVLTSYSVNLKDEVLNPKDYLNYDGYGCSPDVY